jgi:three-Cys-motif partner protein
MTKRPKDNTVGPWAKEKLDALREYLDFYTTVLKKQDHWLRGTIFFDAFAGPGVSRIRTKEKAVESANLFGSDAQIGVPEIEFLKGSPRVALDIANPFTRYIFVERDPKRVVELKRLKAEYQGKHVVFVAENDANTALKDWLETGIDWRTHRAVVFLDPFGMQVPWVTIEALAATKAVEVLINFPLWMAINRLLVRSGHIDLGWQASLDTFFGSPDWRSITYEEGTDLFGTRREKVDDAGKRILEWYRGRLRKAFGHVSTARLITNTRGNPLYYLIWAGPNATGLKGAEYILSKGERVTARTRTARRSPPLRGDG